MINRSSIQTSFCNFYNSFVEGKRKVFIQTVIGRSGSLFIQSLLDGHPHILMFPGILDFYTILWDQIQKDPRRWKELLYEHFIYLSELMKPYNTMQNLGSCQDESVDINYDHLIYIMGSIDDDLMSDRRKFFIGIHYAFGVYFKKDLSVVKSIYCHEHTLDLNEKWIQECINDFSDVLVLCMVKDPVSNYISIDNWNRKRKSINNKIWQEGIYQKDLMCKYCMYWYIKGVRTGMKFPNNFLFIRLEDLQRNKQVGMEKVLKRIGIQYDTAVEQTTFYGKVWNGDNFSDKKAGFRNTALERKKRNIFTRLISLQLWKERYLLNYGQYKFIYRYLFRFRILAFPFWAYFDIKEKISTKQYLEFQHKYNARIHHIIAHEIREIKESYKIYSSYLRSSYIISCESKLNILCF